MKDLMLDIETYDSKPGGIILQIGACYFDRDTGEIGKTFCQNIDARDSFNLGFTMSIDTVLWWMDQSKEAQNSVRSNEKTVIEVLQAFSDFCKDKPETVWSHATFDPILLFCYYDTVKMERPFHYKNLSDLRTLTKLVKLDLRNRQREGIHHNGLDDCKFQVGYAVECLRILSGKQCLT